MIALPTRILGPGGQRERTDGDRQPDTSPRHPIDIATGRCRVPSVAARRSVIAIRPGVLAIQVALRDGEWFDLIEGSGESVTLDLEFVATL